MYVSFPLSKHLKLSLCRSLLRCISQDSRVCLVKTSWLLEEHIGLVLQANNSALYAEPRKTIVRYGIDETHEFLKQIKWKLRKTLFGLINQHGRGLRYLLETRWGMRRWVSAFESARSCKSVQNWGQEYCGMKEISKSRSRLIAPKVSQDDLENENKKSLWRLSICALKIESAMKRDILYFLSEWTENYDTDFPRKSTRIRRGLT